MLISPPFLKPQNPNESDNDWVERMMPVDPERDFPVNKYGSWHGGIHILNTDSGTRVNYVRAIADGIVVSLRKPATPEKRDEFPLNYNGGTDDGYVLLRHENEIGSGENGSIVFYSLYMHLKSLTTDLSEGKKIKRKSALGASGQVDGKNALHFEIFCDDNNIKKITGRNTPELDISKDGRLESIFGDIHFYLPPGTHFYKERPARNSRLNTSEELHVSNVPLYLTMSFNHENGLLMTRMALAERSLGYIPVGDPVTIEGSKSKAKYRDALLEEAVFLYPKSPSAGFELLRFGRVINSSDETLIPSDAPLWLKANYPGGQGFVNLASSDIKKFSDADFPHWVGWRLVDDDTDNNSQCNSDTVRCMDPMVSNDNGLICHFPYCWDISSVASRYGWLRDSESVAQQNLRVAIAQLEGWRRTPEVPFRSEPGYAPDIEFNPDYTMIPKWLKAVTLNEKDWSQLLRHIHALSFASDDMFKGRLWHFEPRRFIQYFKKLNWYSAQELEDIYPDSEYPALAKSRGIIVPDNIRQTYRPIINKALEKYLVDTRSRQAHFYAQGAIESSCMACMVEGVANYSRNPGHVSFASEENGYYNPPRGGYLDYLENRLGNVEVGDGPKFRGRGFKQITARENYSKYWAYRGWVDTDLYEYTYKGFKNKWWSPTNLRFAPPIPDPQKISVSPYCAVDASAWYWYGGSAKARFRPINLIIKERDLSSSHSLVITKSINGGDNGADRRFAQTKRIAKIILDDF